MRKYWPLAVLAIVALLPALCAADDDSFPLPAGTALQVQLTTTLSTKVTQNGDPWSGRVVEPIFGKGQEIVPAHSIVDGRVTYVREPGRVKGPAQMRLIAESITTPDNIKYVIVASLQDAQGAENAKLKGQEGTIQGPGKDKKSAAKETGIGAGVGAAVGALADGGTGALYGAGIGVATALIHSLVKHHKDLILPQGTELTFTLSRDATAKKVSGSAKDSQVQ
jgi:hypothetical protein